MWIQYPILVAAGLFAAAPLAAQNTTPPFDGRWAIVAMTNYGPCDKAYRLTITVKDGAIRSAGWFATAAAGQINSAGRVNMTHAHDGDVFEVRGRVRVQTGKGKWTSLGCAGSWTARKSSSPTSPR